MCERRGGQEGEDASSSMTWGDDGGCGAEESQTRTAADDEAEAGRTMVCGPIAIRIGVCGPSWLLSLECRRDRRRNDVTE